MRIAIVEDEDIYADNLTKYIERYSAENKIEFNVMRFKDAESFLRDYSPVFSIILMDIELSFMNGMDCVKELRKKDPSVVVVFITNLAAYASKGYEVNALDFVVKPVNYPTFSLKLKRAIRVAKANEEVDVFVKNASGMCRIPSSRVMYVEVRDHNTTYHLVDDKVETRGTMNDAEAKLHGIGFLRCNKCYLVNPKYILSIKGNNVYVGEDVLQISQPRRKEFVNSFVAWIAKEK